MAYLRSSEIPDRPAELEPLRFHIGNERFEIVRMDSEMVNRARGPRAFGRLVAKIDVSGSDADQDIARAGIHAVKDDFGIEHFAIEFKTCVDIGSE